VIQATRLDNEETRSQTFRVGCKLSGGFVLDPADAPGATGTVESLEASLTIGFEAAVKGDVFLTYETIEPPTGDELYPHVSGTYQGAGLYYPTNYSELSALTDTSESIRSYPNGNGETVDVSASFFYDDVTEKDGDIRLPDGPDGDLMEIKIEDSYVSGADIV
jgi:hypothetical protein